MNKGDELLFWLTITFYMVFMLVAFRDIAVGKIWEGFSSLAISQLLLLILGLIAGGEDDND
jgi:hypothetical protein